MWLARIHWTTLFCMTDAKDLETVLRIRRATEGEASIVASLIRRSFLNQVEMLGIRESEHPNYVGFELESNVQRRMAAGAHVALARRAEECIGTISWSPDVQDPRCGDIMRVAVIPSQRGGGYGCQLMAYAEEQLVSAGASVARLSIVAQFTRLGEYYQQQGYGVVDVRRVSSLPFELMFMEKTLARGRGA